MALDELTELCTEIREDGFSIRLDERAAEWDKAIRSLGRRRAYDRMAALLCALYREKFKRDFLFTEKCMSFEIRYHADAYFAVTLGGYPRHISTLLFSRAALISHCREIDISVDDVESLRQRLMFRYRSGVRRCYRRTEQDPFRRFF